MIHPQLPIIPRQPRLEWITRYQAAMLEIDRQLAELPSVIGDCKQELTHDH